MVERIGSHKKLKGLSALGASALFMAACAANPDVKPTTSFNPESTPTRVPELVTQKPTPTITETPRPTETELSMEQQASNAVFDYWFSLLNKTQRADEGSNIFLLKNEVVNLSAWQHNIDIIKNGGTTEDQLIVDWVGGELYYSSNYSNTSAAGIKSQGRFIVMGPTLSSWGSAGVTNEQRSQGITWTGRTTFTFDVGWAENQYWPANDSLFTDPKAVEDWLLQREPEGLIENSPINTITFTHDVVFKNGSFIDLDTKEYTQTKGPLGFVEKPLFTMADPAFCQNPDAVSTCQVFKFSNY